MNLKQIAFKTLEQLKSKDSFYYDILTANGEKIYVPKHKKWLRTQRLNGIVALGLAHHNKEKALNVLEWLSAQRTDNGTNGLMLWAYAKLRHYDKCEFLAKKVLSSVTNKGIKTIVYSVGDASWCLNGLLEWWKFSGENSATIEKLAKIISIPTIYRADGTIQTRISINNFIFPVQALARYLREYKYDELIGARCLSILNKMLTYGRGVNCEWWWTFDNHKVVQKYPIYTVHQIAMVPFALRQVELTFKKPELKNTIKQSIQCAKDYGLLTDTRIWRQYGLPVFNEKLQRYVPQLPNPKRLMNIWKVSYCYDMGWTLYADAIGSFKN